MTLVAWCIAALAMILLLVLAAFALAGIERVDEALESLKTSREEDRPNRDY